MAADFEAAFETVSWSYLRAVIKEMNFGNEFIKTMDIMHLDKDNFSRILLNGFLGEKINIYRGIRQGDPVFGFHFNPITGGGAESPPPPRLVFLLSTENGLRWGLEISWLFLYIHWEFCTQFLSFYFAQRGLQDHFLGGMFAKFRTIFSLNFRKL